MSRDLFALLAYEMKRRPEVARLARIAGQMTPEEIRNSPVGLPWMREAIILLKRERQQEDLANEIEQFTVTGHTPDPTGDLRRWTAQDTFLKISRDTSKILISSEILVKTGDLLWLQRDEVWIGTICSRFIDPRVQHSTASLGVSTLSDFFNQLWSKGHEQATGTDLSAGYARPVAGVGSVRFYRH